MADFSSINFKKTKLGRWQLRHNERIKSPSYLIDTPNVEVSLNYDDAVALREKMINEAKERYKQHTGQKFQAKSYLWSAVVNLKPNSTMQDLEKLTAHINKKYGFQCYQIAIHKDEGHIDKGEKKHNYHAHLEFVTLDKQTGRNRQRDLRPRQMSELQSEVAQILQIKRGVSYYQNKQKLREIGIKTAQPKRIEPRAYGAMKEQEKADKAQGKPLYATINEAKAFYNIELEKLRERDEKDPTKFKAERAKFEALCAKIKAKALSKADLQKEYSKEPRAEIESARTAKPQMPQNRALSETKLKNKAELESKPTQNRALADTKATALIQPKSTETTQSVEKAPKIEQPTFSTEALRAISRADNETAQILAFEIKESFAMSKTAKMHENTAKKYAESLTKQGMKAQIYKNPKAERADFSFGVIFAKTSEALALAIEYMKDKLGLTNKEPEIPIQKPKENEISNPSQTKEIKTLNNKPKINEKSKNNQNDSYGMSM